MNGKSSNSECFKIHSWSERGSRPNNLAPYTAGSEVPFEGRLNYWGKKPKKTTIWVYPGSIPIFSALLWSIRTMSTFDMWSKKNIIPLLLLSYPPVDRTKSTADLAHRGARGHSPPLWCIYKKYITAMTKKQKRDRLLSDKLQFLSVHRINLPRSDGLCARSGRCERANCQRLSVSTNRRCPFSSCVSSSEEKKKIGIFILLSYFLKHQRLYKGGASVHSSNPLSSAPTYKISSIHKTSIDSGAASPANNNINQRNNKINGVNQFDAIIDSWR